MKKTIIITLSIVLGVLIILGSLGFIGYRALFGTTTKFDIDTYQQMVSNNRLMPNLDNLGAYKNIYTKYYHKNMLIFASDAYTLVAKYDEAAYKQERTKVEKKYTFHTEAFGGSSLEDIVHDPTFDIDGFIFNTLSSYTYDEIDFPENMYFIGFNDNTHEIAYIYFYDMDLDYIPNLLEDFLREECGWSYTSEN